MKNEYLSKLKSLLDQYNMEEVEKKDIVNDYDDMYNNWIEYGMSEEQVEEKLGEPSKIIKELTEGYKKVTTVKRQQQASKNNKIIAVMPFVSLIAFFIIGFGFDGWAWGWLTFLLIPVVAIIVEMVHNKDKHVLTALSPFAAVIGYLVLGFYYGLWHPGWLVFLVIPVIAIITEGKEIGFLNTLVSLSPFAALIAFFYLGEQGLYNPGWIVFLVIPALGVLNEKNKVKMLLWEVFIIGGALGYLYIGSTLSYQYAWLTFAPLVIYSLTQSDTGFIHMPFVYKMLTLGTIAAYVLFGFTLGLWGFAWIVFLIIPVYAIITEVDGDEKIIALMPFVSLVIFFTLGWFFVLWHLSWMAFLLIPIVAIIKEA